MLERVASDPIIKSLADFAAVSTIDGCAGMWNDLNSRGL